MKQALGAWMEYIYDRINHSEPFVDRYLEGRILDLGCGAGRRLDNEKPVIGLESNQRTAKKADEKGPVIQGDATVLPFDTNAFDTVMCLQVIEHLYPNEATELLREVSRVLKTGGIAIISSPMPRNVWGTFTHIRPYPPTAIKKFISADRFGDNFDPVDQFEMIFEFYYGPATEVWGIQLPFLSPLTNLLANLFNFKRSNYFVGLKNLK